MSQGQRVENHNRIDSIPAVTADDSGSGSKPGKTADWVRAGAIMHVGIKNAFITGRVYSKDFPAVKSTGFCWNLKPSPTLNDYHINCLHDSGYFQCEIPFLVPGTLYFIRAYTISGTDTIYSQDKVFYSHNPNAVADIDSNYYNPVKIGNQVWLAEDLKTTHFNDGSEIRQVPDPDTWARLKTPAWCWYGNDSVTFSFPRGKIYNWYAVSTGKLCPAGWHVPSDEEWFELQNYLGGDSIAGGKLKTTGTYFWRHPNRGATNETGFSSIPGGYRDGVGDFSYGSIFNKWWSSTEAPPGAGYYWLVYNALGRLYHEFDLKEFGNSVRCIKNK